MFRADEIPVIARTSQIFDIEHFQKFLNNVHVCAEGGRLEFIPDISPSVGLFHQNIFRCTKCLKETLITNFPRSHPIESIQQEPNKRLSVAAAFTGTGYDAINVVMSSLCLSITSKKVFLQQLHKHYDSLYDFVKTHFQKIIDHIKYKNNQNNEILNITVSLDGTWKRRSHISNYGIVFLIDVHTGYYIDYEVMSVNCEACNMRKSTLTNTQFDKWYKKHTVHCYKNYNGTSKSMEKEGAVRLFQHSLINGLRYKRMVCDGDACAYEAIKNYYIEQQKQIDTSEEESMEEGTDDDEDLQEVSGDYDTSSVTNDEEDEDDNHSISEDNNDEDENFQPASDSFEDLLVLKEDYVNHVGKRVMKYLIKLKKEKTRRVRTSTSTTKFASSLYSKKQPDTRQQLLDDNQKWGGKNGRTTQSMMEKLSNAYGLAIRKAGELAAGINTTYVAHKPCFHAKT
ncbi:unnamed protein product [Rotaria sp. Silwood2]|nr:unnamed protein product [Rotaria sp. Silwood2]CAF4397916.1 unnamed protein product [Rotaria sp. Silwood2]